MMNDDEEDNNNNKNSGLFGSLFNGVKKIWSPTQNRSAEEKEALEKNVSRYSNDDFFTEAAKKYYSTPASFDKLKNLLEKYYSTNKDKKEFSLTQILSDKYLNNNLYCQDKDHNSLRFVYSNNTPRPEPDIARAISEGEEAFKQEWLNTILEWTKEYVTVIDTGIILEWIEKNVKWRDDTKWLEDREVLPSMDPLLNINTLNITDTFFNDANILKLANWLRNNTKVINLKLAGIDLDNKKAITLAEIFRINKTIKTVDLRGNEYLTEEGIKTLLKIKEFNKSVEKILIDGGAKGTNILDQDYQVKQLEYLEDTDLSQKLNGQEEGDIRVKPILDAMIIGSNEIKGNYEEFLMIFGGKNVGKSTLASILIRKQLAGLYNELTGTWTFKIVNPEIMEPKNEPGKINTPTKFTGKSVIIECPGIGDVRGIGDIGEKTIEHIITSQYYIWQTFNNAIKLQLKLCKFLLTTDSPDNYAIITTLIKDFAKIFKDKEENIWQENIKKLENSVSLIVIHADKTKEHIQNILNEYIINNKSDESLKEYHKDIGRFLKDSVNIFCQPTNNNNENNNDTISSWLDRENLKLGNLIEAKEGFIEVKEGDAYLTRPDKSLELVNELYDRVYDNIYIIGKIILKFFQDNHENLTNPYKSFYSLDLHQKLDTTAFFKYEPLLQKYFPKSIIHENNGAVAEKSDFPALAEIIELKNSTVKGGDNFINDVNILIKYLEIIKYFSSGNEKNQMDNYIHILEQQANFLIFFEKLSDVRDAPNPFKEILNRRIEPPVTVDIHDIIEKMLIPAIKCMKLKKNQPLAYYQEALYWIAVYKELTKVHEAGITKNLTKAWYKIGLIHVKSADEASKQKEFIEQVEENLSRVELSLENVVRAKENIWDLKRTLIDKMELSLDTLIKIKELMEFMEGYYLDEVKLENINIVPLGGVVKKMIEQMIAIKELESDLKGKGLSLEKMIKQNEVIEKTEQALLDQMNLTLEEIIMNKNLNNNQINKYWSKSGLSFTTSILNYPERYGAYKALGDLLCKLPDEDALNYAIKYYEIINNYTGVNHAFSLLEALFQNHFNNLKESLELHYNILANPRNNQEMIASKDEIEKLEAERKEIAFKKIELKIRHGDYEVERGETQLAREHYQQATELATEENDKAKLNDIELKRYKSYQVDMEARKQDNIFIKASYEKLKTGKSLEEIGAVSLSVEISRIGYINNNIIYQE